MSAFFQNTYNFDMPIGIAGRISDCGYKNTLSPVCIEAIPPAVGVMKPTNADYRIMLPRDQNGSVSFSVPLIAGNNFSATVNGTLITATSFQPGLSEDWYESVQTQIEALVGVEEVIFNTPFDQAPTGFQIIPVSGTVLTITGATVTGGASQPTTTSAVNVSGVFFGVTQFIYNRMNSWTPDQGPNAVVSSAAPLPYYEGEVAPTLTQGRIYVVPETVVTSNSPVYLRIRENGSNTQLGSFRGDADSATAVLIPSTQAIWREGNGTVGGLAVLELNLP